VEELEIQEALVIPERQLRAVQTTVGPPVGGAVPCEVWSLVDGEGREESWRLHATARVRAIDARKIEPWVSLADIRSRCAEEIPPEALYGMLVARGVQHGGAFQGVTRLWRGDGEALAEIRLPDGLELDAYRTHPALLDAALQPLGATMSADERTASFLPVAVGRIEWRRRVGRHAWSHVRLASGVGPGGALTADVRVLDEDGLVQVSLEGVRLVPVTPTTLARLTGARERELLYAVDWRPSPLSAGSGDPGVELESPATLAELGSGQLDGVRASHGLDAYDEMTPELDAVATAYVVHALGALGWAPTTGEEATAAGLTARLGILGQYVPLVERFLEILAEDGAVERIAAGWRVRRWPLPVDPSPSMARLRERHPDAWAQLTITERCGARLADVLTGRADPLDLLFPGGSTETAEALYTSSPPARACGALVAAAVAGACARIPDGRTLRVLEVGGGTGGTTAAVLPVLPGDRTEYLFTDVSPTFTSRAAERFQAWSFLRTRPLDLERDPIEQRLGAGVFDIVIAANVVHATRDIRRTLERCRRVLAPGGLLVLVEVTAPQRWIDITFGLTDGWWHFTDRDLRPRYPLLSSSRWRDLLEEMGFDEVATIPEAPDTTGTFAANTLIVARAPRVVSDDAPSWLVLADQAGVGDTLAALLVARGERVVVVHAGLECGPTATRSWTVRPGVREDLDRLLAEGVAAGSGWRGIVHCWAIDAAPGDCGADLGTTQREMCGSLLHVTQALSMARSTVAPRLWVVTRGAQPVGAVAVAVEQSTVLGLGRTIAREHPELRCTLVDLDPADEGVRSECLRDEILADADEDEIVYRAGIRHIARLMTSAITGPTPRSPRPAAEVFAGRPGVLDSLTLRPLQRRVPGPGEVEIEIRAVGLNFKDVLNVLGLYPGDPGPLGSECAGILTAVGPGVEGLEPGQAVVAVAPGSFATHVTAGAGLVARKPSTWSFDEAASIPIAFVTAWYALRSVAELKPGERVLIHAAAGGVGLAAVQVAHAVGAQVFATAGSPEKRAYLTSIGVKDVFDSRSPSFGPELRAHTGGLGVDVVLNSLSGDMIRESLLALAPSGRFVEIGKRGIWTPEDVARLRPLATYHVIDWGDVARAEPERIRAVFTAVLDACQRTELRPLPRRVFPIGEVSAAFRHMSLARHIGKVVVTVDGEGHDVPTPAIRPDGCYVVTGGLSGLGLTVATWLARRGAKALVLMGRRAPSADAAATIETLRDEGAEVRVAQADVASARDVERALLEARATLGPVRGVVHAAGELDDGVLLEQDWTRFARVMAAKVAGAWHLHALTRDDDLDLFVLFSSVASLLGSPGQGNHAAANAYLDALAHHRRALGLSGLSINWGAWSEVGAAARADRERRIQLQGIDSMTPAEGLAALESALASGRPQVSAVAVDWPRFLARYDGRRRPSLLADHVGAPSAPMRDAPEPGLRQLLAEAPAARRRPLLVSHVAARVARVLALEGRSLDTRRPLNEMGLDSLMAVELRNVLKADIGLDGALPATLVFDHPTVEAIVDFLIRAVLELESPAGSSAPAEPDPIDAVNRIEQLSDEDVDRLFAERVGKQGS
jgi:NADPH:quinone reductase-like Zn-dependent oxidoreductase/SAM-dependent methyltransferase